MHPFTTKIRITHEGILKSDNFRLSSKHLKFEMQSPYLLSKHEYYLWPNAIVRKTKRFVFDNLFRRSITLNLKPGELVMNFYKLLILYNPVQALSKDYHLTLALFWEFLNRYTWFDSPQNTKTWWSWRLMTGENNKVYAKTGKVKMFLELKDASLKKK